MKIPLWGSNDRSKPATLVNRPDYNRAECLDFGDSVGSKVRVCHLFGAVAGFSGPLKADTRVTGRLVRTVVKGWMMSIWLNMGVIALVAVFVLMIVAMSMTVFVALLQKGFYRRIPRIAKGIFLF